MGKIQKQLLERGKELQRNATQPTASFEDTNKCTEQNSHYFPGTTLVSNVIPKDQFWGQ